MEYNDQLRHGILDAFSGIIQGMGPAKCSQYLKGEVVGLVTFVSSISADDDIDEDVAKAAINLLGDLCSVMPVSKRITIT